MGETFGHTLSAIVVGVIVLITVTMTMRGQESTVSTMQFASVKQSTMDMIGVMDKDLRNLGSNFPYPQMLSGLAVRAYDTVSTTHRFDFLAQTVRGQLPDTISYRWTFGSSTTKGGHTYPTVELKRFVNGGLTGKNSGVITHFSLELKTATGDPVMVASETRQVEVEMRMISSLGTNGEIRESRWHETFHPMHMGKHDGVSLGS